jgi:hypothetical protein
VSLHWDPEKEVWWFDVGGGGRRELGDPEGLPTCSQLRWLASRGLLEIRVERGERLTMLDCALAIEDWKGRDEG